MSARIRHLIFGNYAEMRDAWDAQVSQLETAPDVDTAVFIATVLEKQLDRANAASVATQHRAALVIPAVGIVAGFLVGKSGVQIAPNLPDHPVALLLGMGVIGAALLTLVCALLSLALRVRSNGPDPLLAVKARGEPKGEAAVNYLNALGFAVQSTEAYARLQARYLNLSLALFGAGLFFVLGFVVMGGLQ